MELNRPKEEMGLASIHSIVAGLNDVFGKGKWEEYELETLSLELGVAFDELTRDKLNLLQILCQHPEIYYNDVLFFLHSVSVINNNIADFETFPLPSSLEIAYAHTEMKRLFGEKSYGSPIQKTVKYILDLEGYSEPLWPFNEIGIKTEELVKGQEHQDTKNKEEAIKRYLEGMNSGQHR